MKKKLVKYYSKINLVLIVISVVLVIMTDFFTFEERFTQIIFLIMVISFLLSEFFDLLVSETSISIIILYLNKYSKIITPILLLSNIVILSLYLFSEIVSIQFIDIFGNISFIYSFIPPVIRMLFDYEYIERISNGKFRRR